MQADRALTFTRAELFWCAYLYYAWETSEKHRFAVEEIIKQAFLKVLPLTEYKFEFLKQGVQR